MIQKLISQSVHTLVVLFGVCTIVFFLVHLAPGDPIETMLGETASQSDRQQLRQALGLDAGVGQQWLRYMNRLLHADLGVSLYSKRAVGDILLERLPATIQLAVVALLTAIVIGLPLGMVAALYKNSLLDNGAILFATFGVSIPNFVLGPVLILFFSVQLGWFPVSGREQSLSVVLPAVTLGSAMAGILGRMIRSTLLEVLHQDYIRSARAKGLSNLRVLLIHALPNTLLPIVTLLGLQFGALLAGAVITEVVFAWPGIGSLLIESIQRRDYPVLQATVLLISLLYVLVNRVTELSYDVIDPRIRKQDD